MNVLAKAPAQELGGDRRRRDVPELLEGFRSQLGRPGGHGPHPNGSGICPRPQPGLRVGPMRALPESTPYRDDRRRRRARARLVRLDRQARAREAPSTATPPGSGRCAGVASSRPHCRTTSKAAHSDLLLELRVVVLGHSQNAGRHESGAGRSVRGRHLAHDTEVVDGAVLAVETSRGPSTGAAAPRSRGTSSRAASALAPARRAGGRLPGLGGDDHRPRLDSLVRKGERGTLDRLDARVKAQCRGRQ